MKLTLRLFTDPVLRTVCQPVDASDLYYINELIPEMLQILKKTEGIALAANQVGITKRFFLFKDGTIIVNPEIVEISEPEQFDEGCLSIPGVSATTQRSLKIKVKYKNNKFEDVETEYSGIEAVAVQHEIDHLNGILYIDKLSPMRKTLLLDKCRKYLKIKRRRG